MASINGIPCTFVKGEAPVAKQRTVTWELPGIDGYGAQLLGLGDTDFQFVLVLYSTIVSVNAWSCSVQALQGQIVTVINDWGNVFARCLIKKASPPKLSPAYHAGGCRGELAVEGVVV
jgi:hypothetical protein